MISAAGRVESRDHRGEDDRTDVVVVGAGLAGLATAIHLRRAGRDVVCVEPGGWPRAAVGESLDFSTVELLTDLGIPMSSLLEADAGFDKRAIEIVGSDSRWVSLWPPRWFAKPPIWCSMVALHADRTELDRWAHEIALLEGVEIRRNRVKVVHADRGTVRMLETDDGRRIGARWFVDASGRAAQLFGRRLGLERADVGPKKVSFWTRFETPPDRDSTVFYVEDPDAGYLEWVWEIPLSTREISVGCVLAAETASRLRRQGLNPESILSQRLRPFDRLRALPARGSADGVRSASFRPYFYRRPIGPNWILVGDAAAFADPLTSNGVTSSLRHASMASSLIDRALGQGTTTRGRRWVYRHNVNGMARGLNTGIERLVYEPPVRRRLGIRAAVILYAFLGIVTNSLYSKSRPTTPSRSACFAALFGLGRAWIGAWRGVVGLPFGFTRNPRRKVDPGAV